MKLKFLMLIFSFLILTACGVTKPVATTHTERIEERVMPIPVSADTIEITLYQTLEKQRGLDTPDERSDPQYKTSVASSNLCKSDERLLTKSKQRIKKELKNQCDLCNLWETPHSEGVNSVRISSTRGVNISRHETDTSTRIKLTLRPDTVFVPYTNHIRSDTIVVPDRICKMKLQKMQMANALLILIIIVATIIFIDRKTR